MKLQITVDYIKRAGLDVQRKRMLYGSLMELQTLVTNMEAGMTSKRGHSMAAFRS